MTYKIARVILDLQDRNLRKIRNVRFFRDGFEYRLHYTGGFGAYIGIDRRSSCARGFEYFAGVSAADCLTVGDAMNLVDRRIEEKTMGVNK